MISDFFTTLFAVSRASWTKDEDDNDESAEQEVGMFNGHIQQANPQLAQSLGFSFTTTFTVWCASDEDVRVGDTLNSIQGTFSVKAKQDNLVGDNQHLELICSLEEVIGS